MLVYGKSIETNFNHDFTAIDSKSDYMGPTSASHGIIIPDIVL